MASETLPLAKGPSQPLNPEMVYRPSTPSSISAVDGDDQLPDRKVTIYLASILRFVLAIITFVAWVAWAWLLKWADAFIVIIYIELFFVFWWNICMIGGHGQRLKMCLGRTKGSVSCHVGPFKCILDGDDDDGDDNDGKQPDRWSLAWIVDLTIAVTLLVFSLVSRGWMWRGAKVIVPFYFVVAGQFIMVIVPLIKFKPLTIILRSGDPKDNVSGVRIRLPDEEGRRALRGSYIAVAT